ncbi:uncharacterized protein AB675_10227 [Cyphellophora attinorum]|uniref:Uncharacterized protein n=1 Tax=Cyphellophora attinorum TaxID=1664694 RepID=A0A0N1H0K7_9EURO|nr:uncharacterized protein AB675_10227 [Phialophora attinorum]KPI37435.1 hypothetical protein AB675_10227 [Phialophora attinorum]
MAVPEPNTDPPHWFWRGVQSAIFYYVSCAPCLDARQKHQRRQEAKLAKKEVVTQQPGRILQPRAFETNTQWQEDILLGPGPPKGWEPHKFLRDARKKLKGSSEGDKAKKEKDVEKAEHDQPGRPSYERRISSAIDNVKDTLRSSLHPEKWNWKRYQREDEWLGGFQTTMKGMWDKMAASISPGDDPNSLIDLKRERTTGSERVDYSRGHIPAVNDLHPPVVSRLPVTREEVAWMILPPPSAAVMAGQKPPAEEIGPRRPLCVIGRRRPDYASDHSAPRHDDRPNDADSSDIEVWDADSSSESAPSTPPSARIEIKKRDMFEALSDTDMFKIPSRPPVQPRPRSWQFHYVIPSPTETFPIH